MAMKENTNTGLTGGFSFRPLTDVTCYKVSYPKPLH